MNRPTDSWDEWDERTPETRVRSAEWVCYLIFWLLVGLMVGYLVCAAIAHGVEWYRMMQHPGLVPVWVSNNPTPSPRSPDETALPVR